MGYSVRCPACRALTRMKAGNFPEKCGECNESFLSGRPDDEIVMPFVSARGRTKAVDDVYRGMEAGAEFRAQKAAADLGIPASEMSGLKITDLASTKHEGEVAAKEDKEAAARLGGNVGFQSNGSEFSAGISTGSVNVNGQVTQGIAPRAGASALAKIQRLHRA